MVWGGQWGGWVRWCGGAEAVGDMRGAEGMDCDAADGVGVRVCVRAACVCVCVPPQAMRLTPLVVLLWRRR